MTLGGGGGGVPAAYSLLPLSWAHTPNTPNTMWLYNQMLSLVVFTIFSMVSVYTICDKNEKMQ